MPKPRLGAPDPQDHVVSMLASTDMSAIPSGLWSSVGVYHHCLFLVPVTKVLQVSAISLLLSPLLVGGGHHYIVPIYIGDSELFEVCLCGQNQLHNLGARMKCQSLVHKVLQIPRGQQENIKQSLRPCVTVQVTHSRSRPCVQAPSSSGHTSCWMSAITRYFFLCKAQGHLYSVTETFLAGNQPGVEVIGAQDKGPFSQAHGTQATFFLCLIFLPLHKQACELHQVRECDNLGSFLFLLTYFYRGRGRD